MWPENVGRDKSVQHIFLRPDIALVNGDLELKLKKKNSPCLEETYRSEREGVSYTASLYTCSQIYAHEIARSSVTDRNWG